MLWQSRLVGGPRGRWRWSYVAELDQSAAIARTITISVNAWKIVNVYPLGKRRERTSWVADKTGNPASCEEGQNMSRDPSDRKRALVIPMHPAVISFHGGALGPRKMCQSQVLSQRTYAIRQRDWGGGTSRNGYKRKTHQHRQSSCSHRMPKNGIANSSSAASMFRKCRQRGRGHLRNKKTKISMNCREKFKVGGSEARGAGTEGGGEDMGG